MNSIIKLVERLFEKYGNVVGYIGVGLLVITALLFAYGSYVFTRWVNWELSYSSDVQMMICESVKPEFLNPGVCE